MMKLQVTHEEHIEVAVDEPCRVVAFIDPHSGLNVQVYKGTMRTHERRVPMLVHPGEPERPRPQAFRHTAPNPFPMVDQGTLVADDEQCMCKHPRSAHQDTVAYGHGPCETCDCLRFTWRCYIVQGRLVE